MNYSTNPFLEMLNKVNERLFTYRLPIIIASSILIIAGGAMAGYSYYQKMASVRACKEFTTAVKLFDELDKGSLTATQEQWASVAKTFESSYQSNKNVPLAGAFLMYQAEALRKSGSFDDALAVMRKAVSSMAVKSIKEAYELKLALFLLDSGRSALEDEGLSSLKKLVLHDSCSVHEKVLYYLGYYFWVKQNFNEAKNYWQQFMIKYGSSSSMVDLTEQVKSKLELLAV